MRILLAADFWSCSQVVQQRCRAVQMAAKLLMHPCSAPRRLLDMLFCCRSVVLVWSLSCSVLFCSLTRRSCDWSLHGGDKVVGEQLVVCMAEEELWFVVC